MLGFACLGGVALSGDGGEDQEGRHG